MHHMESATVVNLDLRRERGRRVERAIDTRRRMDGKERRKQPRRGGRAWVNGHELGGRREALAHLYATHD